MTKFTHWSRPRFSATDPGPTRSTRLRAGSLVIACITALLTLTMPLPVHAQQQWQIQQANDAERIVRLPVSRAVLFSSGVGYFEHQGKVQGNQTMRLYFASNQINDVLKSMILIDKDGGTVTSVTYPSNDPISRALGSFEIDLSSNPTVAQILAQLRGETVTVQAPDVITGKVLNVETRTQVVDDVRTQSHHLSLVTEQGLRTLDMDSVSSIELADPKLQEELNKALALLVSARDTERKPVDIRFLGQGERHVQVGYLVETPIWKTSYRLDLSTDEPLLQGWAIVENTSDNDWEDVSLSLVSGRPISFIQDLYTPLYVPRPVVEPELYQSLRPRAYAEGMELDEQEAAPAAMADELRRGASGRANASLQKTGQTLFNARARHADGVGAVQEQASQSLGQQVQLSQSLQSQASSASSGELFSFTLHNPVDLARRRAAMMPIINRAIEAKRVSIYNPSVMQNHPLAGARLHNTTGLKMLAGPITVFDEGMYAGDARIDHLTPNDKRLISYAVDLDVTVDPTRRHDSAMTAARIVRGVLHITSRHDYQQTYLIKNKSDKPKTMVIEHPRDVNRNLVEPEKASETTPNLYRFDVTIPADQTRKFTVRESRPITQTFAILAMSPDNLLAYAKRGQIDDSVRQVLEKVASMKRAVEMIRTQVQQLEAQRKQLERDQARLREHIRTLGANSNSGRRYVAKLDRHEDEIEKVDRQLDDLRQRLEHHENELSKFIVSQNVGKG